MDRQCTCHDARPHLLFFDWDPLARRRVCVNRAIVLFVEAMTVREANAFAKDVLGGSLASYDYFYYQMLLPSRTITEFTELIKKARAHPLVEHACGIEEKPEMEFKFNRQAKR
jgi:hypothetical protein